MAKIVRVLSGIMLAVFGAGCASSNEYSHYDMAVNEMADGKTDDAILEFQQSLAKDSQDPAVYNALAKAYLAKGMTEQAIAAMEQAIKYSSLDPQFYGPDKQGRARKSEWVADAIAAFKEAKAKLLETYTSYGDDLAQKSMMSDAVASWEKAVALAPDDSDVFKRLGKAYKKSKDTDKALAAWQKVAQYHPEDSDSQKELGYAYFAKGMLDESAGAFKQYVKLKPDDPVGYNNLGTLYTKAQHFEAAKDAFLQALEKDPRLTVSLNGLASAYYYQGDYPNARKYWSKTLELDPDNAKAREDMSTLTKMGY